MSDYIEVLDETDPGSNLVGDTLIHTDMKHFKLGCFDECYLRGGVGCGALLYKGEDQAGPRPHAAAAPAQQPPSDLLPAKGLLHHDDELREESEQDH